MGNAEAHPGALEEEIGSTWGGVTNGASRPGVQNGNAAQFVRDTSARVIGDADGAGTVILPRARPLDRGLTHEQFDHKHGPAARGFKRAFDIVGALVLVALL